MKKTVCHHTQLFGATGYEHAGSVKCTKIHDGRTSLKVFLSQKTLDGKLKTADTQ